MGGSGGVGRHGGRARRGRLRLAILTLLAEAPQHGYALMSEIAERSGGMWQPSPGSVYPVLAQMQDEGLITGAETDGRRVFTITEDGRARLASHADESPWSAPEHSDADRQAAFALRKAALGLAGATRDLARTGSAEQIGRAAELLEQTRRQVYRILGEEPAETSATPTEDSDGGAE